MVIFMLFVYSRRLDSILMMVWFVFRSCTIRLKKRLERWYKCSNKFWNKLVGSPLIRSGGVNSKLQFIAFQFLPQLPGAERSFGGSDSP